MKTSTYYQTYGERARALFKEEGYNCAQAVFLAFSDVTGIADPLAARLTSSLGGGMGRLREVCGAVSGCFLVLGTVMGPEDPCHHAAKSEHYTVIQEAAAMFKNYNGSYVCRELLGLAGASKPIPELRSEAYYERRPCDEYVAIGAAICAEILDKYSKLPK